MPGVELALAIVATIDGCLKYGNALVQICASFNAAEFEITERVLCIRNHWKRTSLQLDFMRRVWQTLDEEHQEIHNQTLQVLVSKLTIAISKIGRVVKIKPGDARQAEAPQRDLPAGVKRWRYILLKECLDGAIKDLDTWQKMFDPSWFLIMKATNPRIDAELGRDDQAHSLIASAHDLRDALKDEPQRRASIFLPEDGLQSARIFDVPFSSAKLAQRTGSSKWLILDPVASAQQVNTALFTKDVRDLARKLSSIDPITSGLLNCYGVIKNSSVLANQSTPFTFVFRTPEGLSQPQSLRSSLISTRESHPLSDRFKLAKELVTSVSFVHTYGFVHKNVRPETILVFRDSESSLGSSFLVGFENFRTADGRTLRSGDSAWEKDLYRHPRRQGLDPQQDYVMQHDIYSLGVCLLEVGLWESFVAYDQDRSISSPSQALELTSERSELRKPFLLKDHLVSLARRTLPPRMGTRYAKIVETCLTCLDGNNADFGDETEFQDADGILVAVRYIEKVLLQLNSISV